MPTSADSIRGRVGLAAEVGEGLLVHAVDEKPAKVSGATPVDPEWARRAGREAVVPLRFVVTAAGGVGQIRIDEIDGDERLGDDAMAAVAGWRFRPAIRAGKPITCWCFQTVRFQLEE